MLADLGQQVLLIDADPQPTLSSYYRLAVVAPHGLTDLMVTADTEATVSQTGIERLHLVYSDDPDGRLCDWIRDAVDGRVRLKHILQRLDGGGPPRRGGGCWRTTSPISSNNAA